MAWDKNSDILEELRRISLLQNCLYFSQYQFQKRQSELEHPVVACLGLKFVCTCRDGLLLKCLVLLHVGTTLMSGTAAAF